jgi:hypothetical protein
VCPRGHRFHGSCAGCSRERRSVQVVRQRVHDGWAGVRVDAAQGLFAAREHELAAATAVRATIRDCSGECAVGVGKDKLIGAEQDDARAGTPAPTPATPYAEESSAITYASSGKTLSERERAAYAAVYTKAPLRQVYDPHWSV